MSAVSSAIKTETGEERDGLTGTLARGLALLDVLVAAAQPLGLAEIAAAAGLEQSTSLRLLRTLEDGQYVLRNNDSKRYVPSPKALRPLPLLHPIEQMRRECAGVLQELAQRIGMTIVLVAFVQGQRLVLDIAQTRGSLTPYYGTWLHGPMHVTGGGKALLSSLSPEQRRGVLGDGPYAAATERSLVTREQLDADMALSAARGYVVSSDEQIMGLTAVAATIAAWNGAVVGCMIATDHTREFAGGRLAEVGEDIRRAAGMLLYQAPSITAVNQLCGR